VRRPASPGAGRAFRELPERQPFLSARVLSTSATLYKSMQHRTSKIVSVQSPLHPCSVNSSSLDTRSLIKQHRTLKTPLKTLLLLSYPMLEFEALLGGSRARACTGTTNTGSSAPS
jgi:hypothetical protein